MSAPSVPQVAPTALPDSPYRGLVPFSERDARFFFGRDVWRAIVADNLRAYRLTLFYGESGVGKTSLLRAGVAHDLKLGVSERADAGAEPELAVVVFADWRVPPLDGLIGAIEAAAVGAARRPLEAPLPRDDLEAAIETAAAHVGGKVLVILDQFEEYFLYHPNESGPGTFADTFGRAVLRRDLRVHFLISIREDALARLDRFKTTIPNLFDNSLRLEHLDRAAAEEAIVGPLRQYNELSDGAEWKVEPALVQAVLDEVEAGKLQVGQVGAGVVRGNADRESRIETPYLQLVLMRLWKEESDAGSHVLREVTLTELGGAEGIVETHLAAAMRELTAEERDVAALIFRYLVTRSRTKIAHRITDLAEFTELPEATLTPVVEKLSSGVARILRPVSDGRYEIYHDVLAEAILSWRTTHEADRELQHERGVSARTRRRLVRVAFLAGALALSLAIVLAVVAVSERNEAHRQADLAHSRELATSAVSLQARNPQLGMLLATEALRLNRNPETVSALREIARGTWGWRFFRGHKGEVWQVAFGRGGDVLVSSGDDGAVRVWDTRSQRALAVLRGQRIAGERMLSRDGRLLVTAGRAGAVRIVDLSSGRVARTLHGHRGDVEAASFDPTGRRIVSTGTDGTARIWDVATGKSLQVIEAGSRLTGAQLAGGRVLTESAQGMIVWDARTKRQIVKVGSPVLPVPGPAREPADPDAPLLAPEPTDPRAYYPTYQFTLGPDGTRLLRRRLSYPMEGATLLALGRRTRVLHDAPKVTNAVFSPDGKRIVLTYAKTMRVVSARSGRRGPAMQIPKPSGVRFSADGRALVVLGSDDRTQVWDVQRRRRVATLPRVPGTLNDAAVDPTGTHVLTAGSSGALLLRTLANGPAGISLASKKSSVKSARFSPDGRRVLTAGGDGVARIWRSEDGRPLATLRGHRGSIRSAEFGAGGRLVATAGRDGTTRIWDVTGRRAPLVMHGHRAPVSSVAFSRDSRSLVSAGADGTARVWRVSDGAALAVLRGPEKPLRSAVFSRDGKRVLGASLDGTARIWPATGAGAPVTLQPDLLSQRPRGTSVPWVGAAFSRDERFVVMLANDGVARVWDVAKRRIVARRAARDGVLNSARFSPDGRWIALGSDDAAVELLRGPAWTQARKLPEDGEIVATAFTRDGRLLATADSSGLTSVWDVPAARRLMSLRTATYPILWTVDITADGSRVVNGADDGFARLYVCTPCLSTDAILAEVKAAVGGRTFTAAERRRYFHDE